MPLEKRIERLEYCIMLMADGMKIAENEAELNFSKHCLSSYSDMLYSLLKKNLKK